MAFGAEGRGDELAFLPARSLEVSGCEDSNKVACEGIVVVCAPPHSIEGADDVGVVLLSSSGS